MQYSFACPLEGCSEVMTVEANSEEEAVDKLTQEAKRHLTSVHPDVHKTDEQVREDILSLMTSNEKAPSGAA